MAISRPKILHHMTLVSSWIVDLYWLRNFPKLRKMPEPFEIDEKGEEHSACPCKEERSTSRKFLEDSTCHGALLVFGSKSWPKRIFWGVVLLVAIGAFVYVTITHITTLAGNPISTSITLTREHQLDFPSVTICSLSILNTTTLRSGGANVIYNLFNLFNEVQNKNPPNISGCMSFANALISDSTGLNLNWGDLTYTARNQPSVLITKCTFAGEDCINDFEPVNTVGGVCYTFNGPSSPSTRTVRGIGIRQGLQLQLSPDEQSFSLTKDYGFRVIIHKRDELPQEQEGIVVGLNSSAYIAMRQVVSIDKTIFSPGYQCRGTNYDNSNQELSFPNYTSYSPSLCLTDCFLTSVANQCQCKESTRLYTPASSSPISQFRSCELQDLCCEVQAFDTVRERCDCPPKCTNVENTVTVSSATHQEGKVGVNIFYGSLVLETRVTKDSYTVWSLISDIGGNTGLFLGFTLLTGVEVLLFVVTLITNLCKKKSYSRGNANGSQCL